MADYRFEHEVIDRFSCYYEWPPERDGWVHNTGLTVADYDGDGRPEITYGSMDENERGRYGLYDYEDGEWTRRFFLEDSEFIPQPGAAPHDVDGDGSLELVSGGKEAPLHWVVVDPRKDSFGEIHPVRDERRDHIHDLVFADIDGDGEDEAVVREKYTRLVYYDIPDDPTRQWELTVIDRDVPGDGTAPVDFGAGDGVDLLTGLDWYENVDGDGSEWVRHPVVPDELDWHPETRVAVGDVDHDGEDEVVITESEEDANARLAVCSRPENDGEPWEVDVVIGPELDFRGLHTLQLADIDGDGRLEIFTAEMENRKTDGVDKRPRWFILASDADEWNRTTILDANLGCHCGVVEDIDGDGRLDIVGKTWRANETNGVDGDVHLDVLFNRSA